MPTLMEYVLLVPDSESIALPGPPGPAAAGPAGLIASDSGTGPRIEPNQTRALAGLFTAAW